MPVTVFFITLALAQLALGILLYRRLVCSRILAGICVCGITPFLEQGHFDKYKFIRTLWPKCRTFVY